MRHIFLSVLLALSFSISLAQSPQGIPFQAVAKDLRGATASLRDVYISDKVIFSTPTGVVVWEETHRTRTTAEGVFTITIGTGNRIAGTATNFSDINWGGGIHYFNLRVAIAPTLPNPLWDPNANYQDMGTTQFWSVPYAFYANKSGSGSSGFYSGSTNPSNNQGANGDFYINTITNTMFGPKTSAAFCFFNQVVNPRIV